MTSCGLTGGFRRFGRPVISNYVQTSAD